MNGLVGGLKSGSDAGIAFSGTGQCSYRVRGVDGSCAKHSTVESYTVLLAFPSPTNFFIPGLKPSFSANPSHRSLSFSSSALATWILQTFSVTSEQTHFYFLVLYVSSLFSCRFRAVD